MSQRTDNYRGGIRKRQDASSGMAKSLDKQLKETQKYIPPIFSKFGLVCKPKIEKSLLLSIGAHAGCAPDGGIYFSANGTPLVTFEAKKQGICGNAHERFAKNYYFLKQLYPEMMNVVFAVGEGCSEKGSMHNQALTWLNISCADKFRKFNTLYDTELSWFESINGFTKGEIDSIMVKSIKLALKRKT